MIHTFTSSLTTHEDDDDDDDDLKYVIHPAKTQAKPATSQSLDRILIKNIEILMFLTDKTTQMEEHFFMNFTHFLGERPSKI